VQVYEIPLSPTPQRFAISLGGTEYRLRLAFHDVSEGGWTLDIADQEGVTLVCGMPLVTGTDLLAQYAYLGIAGKLFVATDGEPEQVPAFDGLGTSSKLYFAAPVP